VTGVEQHSHYYFGWGATLIFMLLGIVFLLVPIVVLAPLRPSKPSKLKGQTYECGEEAVGDSWGRFNPRFYVIALVFVLFDIEILFMYPWAVTFGSLGKGPALGAATAVTAGGPELTLKFAFGEMIVFVAILLVGFAYLWRYGFLEWVRSVRRD
jgi:NADH-quinone oxidoreductase subunit A